MENPNYRNRNLERKYLKNMWKNQFLKVKNSVLALEKDFIELTDRELKDRSKNYRSIFKTNYCVYRSYG